MSYFKGCIGAVDGVHILASISLEDQIPFINRKGTPSQNVMVVYNFDMQFIFAVGSWEGSAHDARVFQTTIINPAFNFPNPPPGLCSQYFSMYLFNWFDCVIYFYILKKYYLIDAGYSELNKYLGELNKYLGPYIRVKDITFLKFTEVAN